MSTDASGPGSFRESVDYGEPSLLFVDSLLSTLTGVCDLGRLFREHLSPMPGEVVVVRRDVHRDSIQPTLRARPLRIVGMRS
jgi:hypothetical protein